MHRSIVVLCLGILKKAIGQDGVPMGEKMPGINEKLNEDEKRVVISHFQSFRPDQTYQAWITPGRLK